MYGLARLGIPLVTVAALGLLYNGAWAQEPLKIREYHPISIDSNGRSDVDLVSTKTGPVYTLLASRRDVHPNSLHEVPVGPEARGRGQGQCELPDNSSQPIKSRS